jgi:TetR/AcrR family transcriptional regulator, mexCD-oprJ operon repressor
MYAFAEDLMTQRTESPPVRRADARQNVDKILEAAITCLGRDAHATMGEIAATAGLGRVTVYGHFPSREALVEAALARLLDQGDAALSALDLSGDPRAALRTLIGASWLLTARAGAVLESALETLPPGRVQALHAKPARRAEALIRRGRREGVLRSDLPVAWMVGVLHHVMKGAAADVTRGQLAAADAPRLIAETLLPAFAPPADHADQAGPADRADHADHADQTDR